MQQRSTADTTHRKWAVRMGVLLGILTFLSGAFAQGGGNVAITGTVTDPSGAMVAGAKVTVTQKNTSATRTDTTNSSGQFNFLRFLRPPIRCRWRRTGFKQYVQDVVLLADQIRDMDIRLQVGEASSRSRSRHRACRSTR